MNLRHASATISPGLCHQLDRTHAGHSFVTSSTARIVWKLGCEGLCCRQCGLECAYRSGEDEHSLTGAKHTPLISTQTRPPCRSWQARGRTPALSQWTTAASVQDTG